MGERRVRKNDRAAPGFFRGVEGRLRRRTGAVPVGGAQRPGPRGGAGDEAGGGRTAASGAVRAREAVLQGLRRPEEGGRKNILVRRRWLFVLACMPNSLSSYCDGNWN